MITECSLQLLEFLEMLEISWNLADAAGKCYNSSVIFARQAIFSIHCTQGSKSLCLQCFDAVGWAAGRASGL